MHLLTFVASDALLQEKHHYLHCVKIFLLFPFNEGDIYNMSSSCFTEWTGCNCFLIFILAFGSPFATFTNATFFSTSAQHWQSWPLYLLFRMRPACAIITIRCCMCHYYHQMVPIPEKKKVWTCQLISMQVHHVWPLLLQPVRSLVTKALKKVLVMCQPVTLQQCFQGTVSHK